MTQPPASGPGPGAQPGRDAGPRGGVPADSGGRRQAPDGARDPRLAEFAQGRAGDTCPPGAGLATVVEELSGPEWRCDGATDDELIGLLGSWNALESWV